MQFTAVSLLLEEKMRRGVGALIVLAIVSGAIGLVVGLVGVEYPQSAFATICTPGICLEQTCVYYSTQGCDPGKHRTCSMEGTCYYGGQMTGECCGEDYGCGDCHWPWK